MTMQPMVIGDAGTAGEVEGPPAMLAVPQPDTMIDAGTYGPLTVRAASVRGAGHRYEGTPRQDDFCLGVGGPSNDWLVVVVADGVSAGPSSHVASRAAVRFGCKLVGGKLATIAPADLDWNEIVGSVAGFVLAQARNEAGDQSLDAAGAARLMATTIVFAIVPALPDVHGGRECVVVPVGDTSAWVLRQGTVWEPVTPVKNEGAAVASSATAALPFLPPGSVEPRMASLAPGDVLFVVTDGVGDPLGDGTGEVGDRLAAVWARPPARYEFASQVDFHRRSHTDDRTAVGVWTELPTAAPDGTAAAADASDETPPMSVVVDDDVPAWADPSTPEPASAASGTSTPTTPPPGAAPATTDAPDEPPSSTDPTSPEPWQPKPWAPTPWKPS